MKGDAMNADQQMRDIVEKAGEKWHSVILKKQADMSTPIYDQSTICDCGITAETWQVEHPCASANPSPTDLKELFRIVRKIGYDYAVNTLSGNVNILIFNKNNEVIGDADADMKYVADAFREALWQAIQEVE